MSKKLTYGQKAVGLLSEPSKDDALGQIKKDFAKQIDQLNNARNKHTSEELKTKYTKMIELAQSALLIVVESYYLEIMSKTSE